MQSEKSACTPSSNQTKYLVTGYHREDNDYSPKLYIMTKNSNMATASDADSLSSFSMVFVGI
jgi:hypothetical protein